MLLNEREVAGEKVIQADPRNPKRPNGEAGANWAQCRSCGRGSHKLGLIRHAKYCAPGGSPDYRSLS